MNNPWFTPRRPCTSFVKKYQNRQPDVNMSLMLHGSPDVAGAGSFHIQWAGDE